MRRAIAVLGAALTLLLLLAGPASAHAEMVGVTPGDHAGALVLLFSEDVDASHSMVLVDGHPLSCAPYGPRALQVDVPAGADQLTWRVAAAEDGHVARGSRLIAHVLAPPAATVVEHPGEATDRLLVVTRVLQYTALVTLLGGLAFLAIAWPAGADVRRARGLLLVGLVVGLLSAVIGLGLQEASLVEVGPSALLHLDTWQHATDSHVGEVWAVRGLIWLLALPLVRALVVQGSAAARSWAWRAGVVVVGLGLVRTMGLTSHGQASAHPWLGGTADLVHLVAASIWFGGLVFLLAVVLPRRDPEELAAVLPRYSTIALGSVAVVVLAGLALSWQLLGGVGALVTTDYGHKLLLKLVAVALLLVAAQRSKGFVQRRLDLTVILAGDRASLRPLVLSITAEAVLAASVLSAAALVASGNPTQ